MNKIERIMVVIDANEDLSARADGLPVELSKALRLIKDKSSVEIRLVSIGYEKYLHHSFYAVGYDHKKLQKDYCDHLLTVMEKLVEGLTEQGYVASCEIGWGHPRYEEIINKAKEFDADLIVQHCRAYAKVEHYHLTHDSWELVRRCPIPLLLVKSQEWGDDITVMAAVDPMHSHNKPESLDNRVIDAASIVASQLGGELHVVHAYAETARPFAVAGTIKSEHSKAFDDLLKDYSIDKDHQHLIDETPLYALKDYSEESNSDIVVMGAISRSRLSEALIGSTTDAALDYIKKDLLIIKPASM